MLDLHMATGAAAVLMIALSLAGFAKIINLRGKAASDYLMRAAALWGVAFALRTIWWDQVRLVVGYDQFLEWSAGIGGVEINTAFNLMVILGGYQFCQFLRQTIPAKDRPHWPWFMAPFYPARFVMFWRRKNDREKKTPPTA